MALYNALELWKVVYVHDYPAHVHLQGDNHVHDPTRDIVDVPKPLLTDKHELFCRGAFSCSIQPSLFDIYKSSLNPPFSIPFLDIVYSSIVTYSLRHKYHIANSKSKITTTVSPNKSKQRCLLTPTCLL